MKLFESASRNLVDGCASNLAAEFSRLCPLPENEPKASFEGRPKPSGRTPSEKAIEYALAEIFAKAKAFRRENRLGIFKRARLARIFQDELAKRGYDADLVTKVTTALVAAALTGD